MLYLLLAPPGGGKTYWLQQQAPESPFLPLAHMSHRQALATLAEAQGIESKRLTIWELVQALRERPGTARLDDLDQVGRKALYSFLALSSAGWVFYATGSDRKRLAPILERQAAILVPYEPPDLAAVVRQAWPSAGPADVARILSLAKTPAAAANLARMAAAGAPLDAPPPARSLYPLVVIALIIGLALWKQQHADALDYATLTAVTMLLYWLRRRFYLRS